MPPPLVLLEVVRFLEMDNVKWHNNERGGSWNANDFNKTETAKQGGGLLRLGTRLLLTVKGENKGG